MGLCRKPAPQATAAVAREAYRIRTGDTCLESEARNQGEPRDAWTAGAGVEGPEVSSSWASAVWEQVTLSCQC